MRRVPFLMGGIRGMGIIPRRRPFLQFGNVGRGVEDFLELTELSLLLWGDSGAQGGKINDPLLCDGALRVDELVTGSL